ncbi:MAG: putative transposase [Cellvibrionaceae bacterium]|jgi:putative transposase
MCHTRCDCKYHAVFISKKTRKLIFGAIRKHVGNVFHDLARQRVFVIEEGRLMSDHVHIFLSIPPKVAVSKVVRFIKGKSGVSIARQFKARKRNFNGEAFWPGGYYVSKVGLDEDTIKEYNRDQEKNDVHRDQLNLKV